MWECHDVTQCLGAPRTACFFSLVRRRESGYFEGTSSFTNEQCGGRGFNPFFSVALGNTVGKGQRIAATHSYPSFMQLWQKRCLKAKELSGDHRRSVQIWTLILNSMSQRGAQRMISTNGVLVCSSVWSRHTSRSFLNFVLTTTCLCQGSFC